MCMGYIYNGLSLTCHHKHLHCIQISCAVGPVCTTKDFDCFAKKSVNRKPFLVQTPTKLFSTVTKLQRCCQEHVEAWPTIFCQATKIICSLTAILSWAGADPGNFYWGGPKFGSERTVELCGKLLLPQNPTPPPSIVTNISQEME